MYWFSILLQLLLSILMMDQHIFRARVIILRTIIFTSMVIDISLLYISYVLNLYGVSMVFSYLLIDISSYTNSKDLIDISNMFYLFICFVIDDDDDDDDDGRS